MVANFRKVVDTLGRRSIVGEGMLLRVGADGL